MSKCHIYLYMISRVCLPDCTLSLGKAQTYSALWKASLDMALSYMMVDTSGRVLSASERISTSNDSLTYVITRASSGPFSSRGGHQRNIFVVC